MELRTRSIQVLGIVGGISLIVALVAFASPISAQGQSSPSDAVGSAASLPSAPANIQAVPADGGARITWDAPSDLAGHSLLSYRVINPSTKVVHCDDILEYCDIDGLTNDKKYGFSVATVTGGGLGPHAYVEVTPAVPKVAPSSPRDLVGSPVDGGALLEWALPADVGSGLSLEFVVTNPSTREVFCKGPALFCEVSGLVNGTKVGLNVRAVSEHGSSEHVYVEVTPAVPAPELHEIVVRAKGERSAETFDVRIGDTIVGTGTAGAEYANFEYTADAGLTGPVSIEFTNDYYDGKIDYNLWVDYVMVNGALYESEADSTYSQGAWTSGAGCSPGFRKSERIACGGVFTYVVIGDGAATAMPADPYLSEEPAVDEAPTNHVVRVRAKGHTGGEKMTMRIGTTIIANITVTNTWRTYRVKLDSLPTGKLVAAFMNDSDDGYNDFNLQIDYVKVDDRKFESEDASTFMAGPGTGEACMSGHRNTETLYCAASFFYADL